MRTVSDIPAPQEVEHFILETTKYCMTRHTNLGTLAPDFVNNVHAYVMDESDRFAHGFALTLETIALKGETTEEYRSVSQDIVTYVFKSWVDHLKYQLGKRMTFNYLPFRLRRALFGLLKVQYTALHQKVTTTVPVKIARICPHSGTDLRNGGHQHIHFLLPKRCPAPFTWEGD